VHTGVWWEELTDIDNLEDLGVDGSSRSGKGALNGLIWLRTGTRKRRL